MEENFSQILPRRCALLPSFCRVAPPFLPFRRLLFHHRARQIRLFQVVPIGDFPFPFKGLLRRRSSVSSTRLFFPSFSPPSLLHSAVPAGSFIVAPPGSSDADLSPLPRFDILRLTRKSFFCTISLFPPFVFFSFFKHSFSYAMGMVSDFPLFQGTSPPSSSDPPFALFSSLQVHIAGLRG